MNPATPWPGQPRRSPLRRVTGVIAAALSLGLLLSGCVFSLPFGGNPGGTSTSGSGQNQDARPSVPKGLESFYTQHADWSSCEKGFQCANIKVPTDYAHPEAGSIVLAAIRLPARSGKKGSILVNPGGPGASGYDFVKDAARTHFTAKLRAGFDMVGFDPRGVKRSAPVTCLSDSERDAAREKVYRYNTDAGLQSAIADNKEVIAECVAKSGPALAHIDTVSSAKDMDILRAVLGDAKLNYLGYSYGTALGATYAELFPDNVGRLVLDGALNLALNYEDLTAQQVDAFEKALRRYVEDCLGQANCPMSGSVDEAMGQIRELVAAVEAHPERATDGRLVTGPTLVSGLYTPLYDDSSWPALTEALGAAFDGDVSLMLRIADIGADRNPDGTYNSNTGFAFNAINCLDYPMVTDTAGMRAEAEHLTKLAPTFGPYFAYGGLNCRDWPFKPAGSPAPAKYSGQSPIVVIGTTGDPATPLPWAEAMRKQLGNASLVTWKGEGHTAYGRSNRCVSTAVDDYFLDGKLPADGTHC